MAGACLSATADMRVVEALAVSANCTVADLIQVGQSALLGPNSQLATGVTALLTLYIAVIGLRLLLGLGTLRVSELTLAAVKIGVVLAFTTSWPLYHQLVFDTLFSGPEHFANQMLGGTGQSLLPRLQLTYDELKAAAEYYAGHSPGMASPFVASAPMAAASLNAASVLMLVSTLGVLLGAKILLAVVLLIGPLFIGMILFGVTQGLFLGWLRAAIALSLAPVMALLALVVQIALLQPQIARLAEIRAATVPQYGPDTTVLVIVLMVAMLTLAGLFASAMIGASLQPPGIRRASKADAAPPPNVIQDRVQVLETRTGAADPPPRVAAIAAAASAMDRRDVRLFAETAVRAEAPAASATLGAAYTPATPLGRSHRTSARPSGAASSQRRDR